MPNLVVWLRPHDTILTLLNNAAFFEDGVNAEPEYILTLGGIGGTTSMRTAGHGIATFTDRTGTTYSIPAYLCTAACHNAITHLDPTGRTQGCH